MYPLKSLVHDANFTPNWAIQQQRSSRLTAAASGPGLDALALADLDGGLVVDGRSAHSLLDLSGHGQESLLDVGSALGGGLKEGDSKAVGEFLQDETDEHSRKRSFSVGRRRTLATVYSTTFLSSISLLFPTRSLLTPSVA